MKFTNRIVVGVIAGLICLPLVAALAGAANIDATWRTTSDSGYVSFAGYGYGGALPDAHIRVGSGLFVGDNIYGNGIGQTISTTVRRGGTADLTVRIENDGTTDARISVFGPGSSQAFRITYLAAGVDITERVVAGTYRITSLSPGERARVRVQVKAKAAATVGAQTTVRVVVESGEGEGFRDTVKARVRRT